jgi:hypothetical protein
LPWRKDNRHLNIDTNRLSPWTWVKDGINVRLSAESSSCQEENTATITGRRRPVGHDSDLVIVALALQTSLLFGRRISLQKYASQTQGPLIMDLETGRHLVNRFQGKAIEKSETQKTDLFALACLRDKARANSK